MIQHCFSYLTKEVSFLHVYPTFISEAECECMILKNRYHTRFSTTENFLQTLYVRHADKRER